MTLSHETGESERSCDAPLRRVFAAWADNAA